MQNIKYSTILKIQNKTIIMIDTSNRIQLNKKGMQLLVYSLYVVLPLYTAISAFNFYSI